MGATATPEKPGVLDVFTREQAEALLNACGAAGVGFEYGGGPDLKDDPAVQAQEILREALGHE